MAFQTSVLRNGAWVTETVNLHAILKGQNTETNDSTRQEILEPPRCGLLTRTLVESARANAILPVRLRSPEQNDIAFIGDHFVRIRELRKDGRLKDIVRKNDFGCRIRNACVVGSANIPELKDDAQPPSSSRPYFKTENDHAGAFSFSQPGQPATGIQMPPQLLLVALENGDSVFLFVRPEANGRPAFIASRFSSPKHMKLGFHMAVDPSSRYAALAGPTDYFSVYELDAHAQMNERYLNNEPIRPIRSFRIRSVRGVIQKMTFLYPRPGDDHHIILLLVIVRKGKSRTVLYEWELGNDLKVVFAEEKRGHRMPVEFQMPLLLIPLTVQSAFIAISEDQVAVCTECLHGPPRYEPVPIPTPPATVNHRGRHRPLWTAWSRPFRLQKYSRKRDCIYLAREDGVVLFLEADQDSNLDRSTAIDPFPCNISSAFACVFDFSTDVLILGSDSGPGGIWKIPPRQPSELLGTLPNWSPAVDFTTTDKFTGWQQSSHADKTVVPWQHANKYRKPDRIFGTCEGGSKGSITEYRYGLKANIGLDLDYGDGVKRAWLLPFGDPSSLSGYLLLLSMPDSTAALLLPSDFSSASAPADGVIPYNMTSATLALASSAHLTVQITTKCVVLVTPHRKYEQPPGDDINEYFGSVEQKANGVGSVTYLWHDSPDLSNASISDASVVNDRIAVAAHTDAKFKFHMFKIDVDQLTLAHVETIGVEGEVTCISLGADYTILAGIRYNLRTYLGYCFSDGPWQSLNLAEFSLTSDDVVVFKDSAGGRGLPTPATLEGIESIVAVGDAVVLGTRSGEVMTVRRKSESSVFVDCEKFGTTTANVSCSYPAGATDPRVLVACNNILVSVGFGLGKHDSHSNGAAMLKEKRRVWPVDASKLEAPAPPVHFAAVVDLPSEDGITPVLMISGSRLLIAEMHQEPGLVPRSIPVEGTPNRVIYCQSTQCLVAAVNQPSGPTLAFINPDTGEDIGTPIDKTGQRQACITGLGSPGDRILGLTEWTYRRDDKVWNFVLLGTKTGRLIVVATEKVAAAHGRPQTWHYRTRFRKQVSEPIYSVLGYDDGVIYCTGSTICWEVLDPAEKRLKSLKTFALASPAVSLRLSSPNGSGKLLAMTAADSLQALDHAAGIAEEGETRLCHVDPWKRNGVDFVEVLCGDATTPSNNKPPGGSGARGSGSVSGNGITLIADRDCGVAGLWVPWQTPDRECEVVLEAELPASIRKFVRGRTRPVWEQRSRMQGPKYGRLAATADDAEILGVALDGSVYQFLMLSVEAWRVLRFVQNLVVMAGEMMGRRQRRRGGQEEDGEEGDPEPRMDYGLGMHVDGDILRRCLEERALERLVVKPEHVARFVELLGELDGGEHTKGMETERDVARYFGVAYEVLGYYLTPAF